MALTDAQKRKHDKEFEKYIRRTQDPTFNLSRKDALMYAGGMGVSDTWRGVKQMFHTVFDNEKKLEELRRQDKTLNAIFDNEEYGGAAMGAFMTASIIGDPAGLLVGFGTAKKAKNILDLAKYGAMAGGAFSGASYVSEDLPGLIADENSSNIVKRLEYVALGAGGGAALGSLEGKAAQVVARMGGKPLLY